MIALLLAACTVASRRRATAMPPSPSCCAGSGPSDRPPLAFDRTMRVDYCPHRRTACRRDVRARSRRQRRRRGRAAAPSSSTRPTSGKYRVRGAATSTSGQLLYSRGFASVYGEWETTAEAQTAHRTFHESLRFPWPGQPVRVELQKRQARQRVRDGVVDRRGSRLAFRERRRVPPRARHGLDGVRERPGGEKVDLLLISEGYTQAELPKFHRDADTAGRRPVRAGAVQEPARRLQRPGPRSALAAERREPAERRRLPPHAALGRVQHLRFGALRPHPRQPRAARCRGGGALRVHRDPGQRADLRRRRHLQRPGDRVGGQRRSPSTCSSTSSATISPRWPTSTTRRTSPTRPAPRSRRSRGSRT